MIIHLENRQRDLKLSLPFVRELVSSLLSYLSVSCEEIAIYFVTGKKICDLHAIHFGDPSITDCISFPIDDRHLGEVFVCPKAAIAYASTHPRTTPHQETILYVIHGILHLVGYDDLTPSERKKMKAKERECLAFLRRSFPQLAN